MFFYWHQLWRWLRSVKIDYERLGRLGGLERLRQLLSLSPAIKLVRNVGRRYRPILARKLGLSLARITGRQSRGQLISTAARPLLTPHHAAHLHYGQAAEDAALSYLERQGLTLMQRNYRFRGGEIDLIMADQSTLVFVEVRARRNGRFGSAAASIDRRKRQTLKRGALIFCQQQRWQQGWRIDAVTFDAGQINWLRAVAC